MTRPSFAPAFLFACAILAACSDPDALQPFVAKDPGAEPDPVALPSARAWQTVGANLPEAILAVSGTSRSDVYTLAADKGAGPRVYHFDGVAWKVLSTATVGDLWSVHALASGGPAFMGGAAGTVLRWDGKAFLRLPAPAAATQSVFGVWARTADDVYAVGGTSTGQGFVWHYDGKAFTPVALPEGLPREGGETGPAFFGVWSGGDDTWICGSAGALLHRKGSGPLAIVPTRTGEPLFGVHGAGGQVYVVGGGANAVALQIGDGSLEPTASVRDVSPRGALVLSAVHASATQGIFAAGEGGAVLRFDPGAGRFEPLDSAPALPVQSLRAAYVTPEGDVWLGGGEVLSPSLDRGALAHLGTVKIPALPLSTAAGLDVGYFQGEKAGAPRP